ncbi:adhesion G-protein coupled receptor G2-like isoform X1 [Acanthaster planci]|uniref:Adhesion G-protein coupled receptor G2-like isoform X1 n=1 Tax=Acanthaster planci TaxID=133434 RepID=A0A8B7YTY7_ACAPL|nr:adhesion G-protein coupled receptor G2-like isoform X1 [Acanthaster planci]
MTTIAPTSLLFLVLLLIPRESAAVASQQPLACGDSTGAVAPLCRCTVDGSRKIVNCSDLQLQTVPAGIPDDTHILNLSDNSIEELSSDVFNHLVELRELYMVQNAIRSDRLDVATFSRLSNLQLLDMSRNRLRLQEASDIEPFLPLFRLKTLDMAHNNIATIDTSFLTVLDRLENLYMTNNPLVCDCNLLWFKNWLLNKGTQPNFAASGVQCFTPESVRQQTVDTARFCIPVQRCYFCDSASTNAACNFAQQQCSGINPACQNEVRVTSGRFLISKSCQALDACLVNAQQNQNDCSSSTVNSVCRYCCQGDKCNAPETAILNGYRFPFPDEITEPPTAAHQAPLRELVCEGGEFSISCGMGGTIDVQWALYGREDGSQACFTPRATPCGDPEASLSIVREMCQEQMQCGFVVSNERFGGDPCYLVLKYLVVNYTCNGQATSTPVRQTTTAESTRRPPPAAPTSRPPVPAPCPAEETQGVTGTFQWPETSSGDIVILPCAYDLQLKSATRLCGDDSTGWVEPNTRECPTASTILEELSNVTIVRGNALDVSETLTDVTSVPDVLKPNDVSNAVNTFENLANALGNYQEESPDVFGNVLDTLDQLTGVPSDQLVQSQLNDDSSSRLLRSVDTFNLGVQFQSNVLEEDTPSVDVVLVDITDPMDNGLLFFGSGKDLDNAQPTLVSGSASNADEVQTNNKSSSTDEIVKGSIYLPNSLLKSVGNKLSRCQFVMYEETTFFDVIQESARNRTISNKQEDEVDAIPTTDSGVSTTDVATNSTSASTSPPADCIAVSCREGYKTVINSVVISAAVADLNITNLQEPVTVTFRKARMDADNPRCVFWDEAKNGGWGGWSNEGCSLDINNNIDDTNVVCKCNHLTNFAMLMDIYDGPDIPPGHQLALSIISYAGCTLSLIGLVLTLVTYTCCGPRSKAKVHDKKFRGDKRAKVLVNFVISLIFVNVFFIAASVTAEFRESAPDELCMALAVCLHFSLLAAMAWMAIQAFNMYMALVRVFATYYSHFLLKMVIVGWGIPLVIVGITLGADLQNYGSNDDLCWLSGIPFYVAYLLPVCLILLFNVVVFVAVTWKLCQLRKSKISTSDRFDVAAQLRATVSVTILLGLTWLLGFFAIGDASLTFSYLFAAFNSLQGFAVFVFQCLLQPEMRQRWVLACCPYCAPETGDFRDSKSGVYSRSESQTNGAKAPNNNWRKGTTSTAASSYMALNTPGAVKDNPVYENTSAR